MKTALIVALCAGALIQSAPSPASAKSRKPAAPAFNLGSVAFKKLPKDARAALDDYRRRERATPYRCYGLSEKKFEDAIGLLAPTDYNGDGATDYLFNSPCRPRDLQPAADILMSNPLGYEVARNFDAFVDVVNGQPALLVEATCEEDSPEDVDGRVCYLARIFDRSRGYFDGAQRVSLAADGSGFIVASLERPRRAPAPPPVAMAPLDADRSAACPGRAAAASRVAASRITGRPSSAARRTAEARGEEQLDRLPLPPDAP